MYFLGVEGSLCGMDTECHSGLHCHIDTGTCTAAGVVLGPLSRMLSGNYWDTEMSVVRRATSININFSLTTGPIANKLHMNVP